MWQKLSKTVSHTKNRGWSYLTLVDIWTSDGWKHGTNHTEARYMETFGAARPADRQS